MIIRTMYYYIRDINRRPIITVCYIETDTGERARGIAICSKHDNCCKKKGRELANNRAVAALLNKDSSLCVHRSATIDRIVSTLDTADRGRDWKKAAFLRDTLYLPESDMVAYKSLYNPIPNSLEDRVCKI
jgi:hypothetical protein